MTNRHVGLCLVAIGAFTDNGLLILVGLIVIFA